MKVTLSCTEEGRARASAHSKHVVSWHEQLDRIASAMCCCCFFGCLFFPSLQATKPNVKQTWTSGIQQCHLTLVCIKKNTDYYFYIKGCKVVVIRYSCNCRSIFIICSVVVTVFNASFQENIFTPCRYSVKKTSGCEAPHCKVIGAMRKLSFESLFNGLNSKGCCLFVACFNQWHPFFSGEGKPEPHFQDCFSPGRGAARRRDCHYNPHAQPLTCHREVTFFSELTWKEASSWSHSPLLTCSAELQGHHGDGRASEENHRAVWP